MDEMSIYVMVVRMISLMISIYSGVWTIITYKSLVNGVKKEDWYSYRQTIISHTRIPLLSFSISTTIFVTTFSLWRWYIGI